MKTDCWVWLIFPPLFLFFLQIERTSQSFAREYTGLLYTLWFDILWFSLFFHCCLKKVCFWAITLPFLSGNDPGAQGPDSCICHWHWPGCLDSKRKVWNVSLRKVWHLCLAALWRLLSDKCLKMTGMSAKKMPARVLKHKPYSSVSFMMLGVDWRVHFSYAFWMNTQGLKISYTTHTMKSLNSKTSIVYHYRQNCLMKVKSVKISVIDSFLNLSQKVVSKRLQLLKFKLPYVRTYQSYMWIALFGNTINQIILNKCDL